VWLIPEFCGPQLQAPDAGALLRLLLLSPALEELVVRAGLQEWLMRRAPLAGVAAAWPVVASALAFGLLHLRSGWPHALAVTVPGLVLALLYQRTRSWCWCACVHSVMNALAISVCSL
jgi:membrane protease YdiL (CAAX protease family)